MKYILPLMLGLVACAPGPIVLTAPTVPVTSSSPKEEIIIPVVVPEEIPVKWEIYANLQYDDQYQNIDETTKLPNDGFVNVEGHYSWRGVDADLHHSGNRMCVKCSTGMSALFECDKDRGAMKVTCGYLEFNFICVQGKVQ